MRNIIETITGAAVLAVAVWFITYFYNNVNPAGIAGGYVLKAKFEQADGVGIGTAVKIGGVKIGVVSKQSLDTSTYQAVLDLSIKNDIHIPTDSSIKVASEGLIGEKYLQITPGGDEQMLKVNEDIHYTQSSVNLESLISKMMFNSSDSNSSKDPKHEASPVSEPVVPNAENPTAEKTTIEAPAQAPSVEQAK